MIYEKINSDAFDLGGGPKREAALGRPHDEVLLYERLVNPAELLGDLAKPLGSQ
jgi:hypothetical protein